MGAVVALHEVHVRRCNPCICRQKIPTIEERKRYRMLALVCSELAIDLFIKSHVLYFLLMLLGFLIYDSHCRFVQSMNYWRVSIKYHIQMILNRWFQGYYAGYYQDGYLERFGYVSHRIGKTTEKCIEALN